MGPAFFGRVKPPRQNIRLSPIVLRKFGNLSWDAGQPWIVAGPRQTRIVYRERISETERSTAIREIEAREMDDNPIYICRRVKLQLTDRRVNGYTLVVNRADRIFAGSLTFEETARRIATYHGDRSHNIDYLSKTVSHLDEMDIPEGYLHLLLHRANAIRGTR